MAKNEEAKPFEIIFSEINSVVGGEMTFLVKLEGSVKMTFQRSDIAEAKALKGMEPSDYFNECIRPGAYRKILKALERFLAEDAEKQQIEDYKDQVRKYMRSRWKKEYD